MSTSTLAAIDIGGGVSSAWASIANFVPKLAAFLVIFLIGWIVARVLGKVVGKVLQAIGFDKIVERGGLKEMMDRGNYKASEIIAKVVYYAVLLIGLEVAFGVFGPNPISNILTDVVGWLPKLIIAMVIIVVVGAIAKAVKDLVGGMLRGLSYGALLGTIASVFIWGLGIIAALNQVGIATAITTPVLITVLATIGGVVVVGMGGSLIKPMQQRWETWIGRAEDQLPAARAHGQAYQRGREDAMRSGGQPAEQVPQHAAQQPTRVMGQHGAPQQADPGWEPSWTPGGDPGSAPPPAGYR